MGQTYTLLSEACYHCNTPETPENINPLYISREDKPIHLPSHNRIFRSENPSLIEWAYDPFNPCDICGLMDFPVKKIGCWVICQKCEQ
jgi:hypothetical protein